MSRKKQDTMTFQPTAEVREILNGIDKGERAARINESVRLFHRAAAISIARRKLAEAQTMLDTLERRG